MKYKSIKLRQLEALIIDDSPVNRTVQDEGLLIDDKSFPAVVINLRYGLQMALLLATDKDFEFDAGVSRFDVACRLTEIALRYLYGVCLSGIDCQEEGILRITQTHWTICLKAIGAEILDPRYSADLQRLPFSPQEVHEAVQAISAMGSFPD